MSFIQLLTTTDCNQNQINLRDLLCVLHCSCPNPLSPVGREVGKTGDTSWTLIFRQASRLPTRWNYKLSQCQSAPVKMNDHNSSYHALGKDLGQDLASYGTSRMPSDSAIIGFPSESTPASSSIMPFPSTETTLAPFHGTHYDSSPTQNSLKRKLDEPTDFVSRKEHRSLYAPQFESNSNLAYPALPPLHQQSHHHHHMPSQSLENMPISREFPGPDSIARDIPGRFDPPEENDFMFKPGMPFSLPGPAGPKAKFTEREDETLIELKEVYDLTWKQIQRWFPGRTSGTLQVRYCTKLKRKPIEWTAEKVCLTTRSFK